MYFKYLDFPEVPNFVEELVMREVSNFQLTRSNDILISTEEKFLDRIKQPEKDWNTELGIPMTTVINNVSKFIFLDIPDEIYYWAKQEIPYNILGGNIQIITGGTTIITHIDEVRTTAYNYLFELGGESVCNCFYQPKSEFNHLTTSSQTIIPYDKINMVESVYIEKRKWHLLAVNKIHSVENLDPSKLRITLSLSVING